MATKEDGFAVNIPVKIRTTLFLRVMTLLTLPVTFAVHAEDVHIGMSTPLVDTNPVAVWVRKLQAELLGRGIDTKVFPSSTLGSEIERAEQVILGLLHINLSNGQDAMQYSPLLRSLRMPFVFRSPEEVDCLAHGTEFLERVNHSTRPRGIEVVDVVQVGGMSALFSTQGPIDSMDILRNRRIRAMDRIQLVTIESWGASSVQVAWEEVTTALQTSVADSYLNPPGIPLDWRHTRHLKYMLGLNIFPGIRFVTLSSKWLWGLSEAERSRVIAAIQAARPANRQFAQLSAEQDLRALRDEGVSINLPDETFRDQLTRTVASVYDEFIARRTMAEVQDLLQTRCRESGRADR